MIRPFFQEIDSFVPHLSVDCVVFGYHDSKLHILLLKFKEVPAWALPGGFVQKDKAMEEVINDVLFERTGLNRLFFEQFQTFSSLKRGWQDSNISRLAYHQVMKGWTDTEAQKVETWLNQRFISTGFIALINSDDVTPIPDQASELCQWVPLDKLPDLILDHAEIIEKAISYLKARFNYLPIGKALLPEKFTIYQLQSLYQTITGKVEDRGNFHRKVMKLNVLNKHKKLMSGAQNKAPYLYSIKQQVYEDLLKDGVTYF